MNVYEFYEMVMRSGNVLKWKQSKMVFLENFPLDMLRPIQCVVAMFFSYVIKF